MIPSASLTAPEFAYKSKYEETLWSVLQQMGISSSQIKWQFSNDTLLGGSLTLVGESKAQRLPKLSIHLELSEVRIVYTFWLSTILRAKLDWSGATFVRGLKSRLTFGEYMGQTVEQVLQEAPTYIEWAVDEVENFELDDEAAAALEEALGFVDDLEGLF